MECEICKSEFNTWIEFKNHLIKTHNMNLTSKEYYDKFLKKETEGICIACKSKTTTFKGLKRGYLRFCSGKCANNSKEIKSLIKNKRETTCLKKYGVKSTFESEEIKQKVKNTCLKHYGVDNPFKAKDFNEKSKKTKLKKYGNEFYRNNEKIIETNLKRYGVTSPLQNKKIKAKFLKTNNERYGGNSPLQNKEVRIKQKQTIAKNNSIRIISMMNPDEYKLISLTGCNYTIKCLKCENEFIINQQLFRLRIYNGSDLCLHCNPLHSHSKLEEELMTFLKDYSNNIEYYNKTILNGKELDIYLPDLKMAFEFNGLYWHGELQKNNDYHLNKTKKCEEKSIHLIHVYEDDWVNKKNIVKSRILNLLGKSERIYARKCEIKEVNNKDSKSFLECNHIQGFVPSIKRIGLYYNNVLVSLMTFGGQRRPLGFKTSKAGYFELLRFCNKLNTTVIGGANKLFKHFINSTDYNEIVSYADRSWTMNNGNTLYDQLGFTFDKETKPNYYYVTKFGRENRYKYRKDILVKEGFDKSKSEHEIMLSRGIYRIYNSGQLKYIFKI